MCITAEPLASLHDGNYIVCIWELYVMQYTHPTHTCGIRIFTVCIITLAQQMHLTGTASLAPAC